MSRRGPTLGVGVVGLGDWGVRHVAAWNAIPGVSVRALASRNEARARLIAERFDVPHCHATAAELAADPEVDLVSVANDERDHLESVLAVVAARKPVLVEKPMALTLEDAQTMVDAAEQGGVPLMPGHVLRFDPRFAAMKDAVVTGELGDVVSIHARRLLPVDRYATYDRTHIALNVGIHDLDLALWYMADQVIRVSAFERNIQGGGSPDLLWVVLEFARGGIAVVNVQWLVPERTGLFLESLTEVTGTRGIAAVRQPGDGFSLWGAGGPLHPDTTLVPTIAGSPGGALRDELSYFARCVTRGVPPAWVTAADGLRALDVAIRVRDAAQRSGDDPTAVGIGSPS